MDDALIDDSKLTLEERSLLPKKGFFRLDSMREDAQTSQFAEYLAGKKYVMLVDGDADGLAAAVLGKIAFPEDDFEYVTTSPNDLYKSVDMLAKHVDEDAEVYVVDLCLDAVNKAVASPLEYLAGKTSGLHWYDHHQWREETLDALDALGVDLVVGESDEVCAADVTLQELEDEGYEFPDYIRELVTVTRDHDLWINDDDRSKDLADLSQFMDTEEYVSEIEENGADVSDGCKGLLERKRREKDRLVELAVNRVRFEEIGDIRLAQTYGRCSQNEVAEDLRERGADAVTVVKPEGGMSIRGSEGFEKCHVVAEKMGGGGHPQAAGCKPDIFDNMLDYAMHWVTQGEVAQNRALETFVEVIEEE
ncbi:MAG: DHH family phosphoesterase [Halobacteria archaeon]